MYAIIAGGGKVGFFLARELIEQGHEILIVENNAERAEIIANELGNVVLRGNADEASTLAEAGAERADVVIAVTGDDEDNLVLCQVAKRRFGTRRTFARRGSARLPRLVNSCKSVASVRRRSSAPSAPPSGLFGRRKRSQPPNRPGGVGAEPPHTSELTALQERRTRGRGAEPLRAKRVPRNAITLPSRRALNWQLDSSRTGFADRRIE